MVSTGGEDNDYASPPRPPSVRVRQGEGIAILAFGAMLAPALMAGEALNATVVNMRFIKPLDQQMIEQLARTHELLVTVEENVIAGGAGSAVNEYLMTQGQSIPVLNLGLPDQFISHGDPADLLAACGLDAKGIERAITSHGDIFMMERQA